MVGLAQALATLPVMARMRLEAPARVIRRLLLAGNPTRAPLQPGGKRKRRDAPKDAEKWPRAGPPLSDSTQRRPSIEQRELLRTVLIHASRSVLERKLGGVQLTDRLNHRRARPRASEHDAPVDLLPSRRERTIGRDPVALGGPARALPVERDVLTAQLREP